jgi:hypothetical protein
MSYIVTCLEVSWRNVKRETPGSATKQFMVQFPDIMRFSVTKKPRQTAKQSEERPREEAKELFFCFRSAHHMFKQSARTCYPSIDSARKNASTLNSLDIWLSLSLSGFFTFLWLDSFPSFTVHQLQFDSIDWPMWTCVGQPTGRWRTITNSEVWQVEVDCERTPSAFIASIIKRDLSTVMWSDKINWVVFRAPN